jgi:pyruvate/2-oxoacid:ferredoxin oxidoreductase beta subunit
MKRCGGTRGKPACLGVHPEHQDPDGGGWPETAEWCPGCPDCKPCEVCGNARGEDKRDYRIDGRPICAHCYLGRAPRIQTPDQKEESKNPSLIIYPTRD